MIRQARAMLHAWEKFGLPKAQAEFELKYGGTSNFKSAVRGKIEFVGQIRERPDAAFKKLAAQFNKLSVVGGIRVQLTAEEIARQATWILWNGDTEQSTAFFVEKYGLITCAHCVGPKMSIVHAASPTRRFPVNLVKSDKHRDLAVLTIPDELKHVVPIPLYGGKPLKDGSEVVLFGCPNHSVGQPIRVEQGKLIRTFPKSAVSYFEISPKIIEGNSGGPLVDDKYRAIGVAVRGLSGSIDLKHAEFFAVNCSELVNWLG
jgi:S1-C subfamily serine protease